MTTIRTKLLVAAGILAVAVGFLIFAGAKQGFVYSLPVDQFVQDEQFHPQRVRLTGKVATDGLEINGGLLEARFQLVGDSRRLPVTYHGIIPDMFKPEHDVIVEGRLDTDGVFQADLLMTKCASKYEEKPQSHPEMEQAS